MATSLFIFSAIRYGTGWDYYAYVDSIKTNDIDHYEFLSQYLMRISHHYTPQLFFVVTSFLIVFPIALGCKKMSRNPALSLMVYALIPQFYVYSFDVVRNAVAWSLVFCSYAFFKEKKIITTILLVVAALGFHVSVLISLPIFILHYITISRKVNVGVYISSFILSMYLGDYLQLINMAESGFDRMSNYVDAETTGGGSMKWAINMIGVFFLVLWNRISNCREENAIFLTFINIGVSLWNLFYGVHISLATRFNVNYMIFMIVIIPELLYCFKRRRLISNCILLYSFAFCAASFYANIAGNIRNNGKMAMFPYQTIFNPTDYSNVKE